MTEDDGSIAKPGIRADFWFGLGLVILGLIVAVESWRMPRLTELNVDPMTAPGLVPGMLGVIIFLLGGILFLRAASAGGWRLAGGGGTDDLALQTRRFLTALALCMGYAVGLIGTLPFWAATGTFVFIFIVIFEWQGARSLRGHARALATSAAQAVVIAATVTYIFEKIFLVRLP